jgi:hypothetical protein
VISDTGGNTARSSRGVERFALPVVSAALAFKTSGKTAPKAPPQGLFRNLLLGRPLQGSSAQEPSAAASAADGIHATSN